MHQQSQAIVTSATTTASFETAVENTHAQYCMTIANICKPLAKLGITYFHYIKSYHDNSRISLSNHQAWSEHYYNKKYYQNPAFDKTPAKNKNSCYLWLNFKDKLVFKELRESFNIDHGLTLAKPSNDHCEFYYFGTNAENDQILSFYLNNFILLERFCQYFMSEAYDIIQHAEKARLKIPKAEKRLVQTASEISAEETLIESFIAETTVKTYRFSHQGKLISLSARQVACIQGLLQGETAKSIANKLNISFRTVETYIDDVKQKVNCHRKLDLIRFFDKIFKHPNHG